LKTVKVQLKQNPYNIYIGHNTIQKLKDLISTLRDISKIVIITNNIVNKLHMQNLSSAISDIRETEIFVVPDGEIYKSLNQVEDVFSWMIEKKFDRSSLIIAFGGGVIGDLAGFVAATYLRGVRLIQIPTTLLAQVDSSIGGKVGVNHRLGKNLIGAFHQPLFVFADIHFLNTLSRDEYMSGMGEVVKYGLIGNKKLFGYLISNFDSLSPYNVEINEHIVQVCARQKANIVEIDEKEMGMRATLNFGHTFGHALEKYFNFKELKHGQAVLLGMKCAVFASQKLNYLRQEISDKIVKFIDKFDIHLPQKLTTSNISDLINLMQNDKKVKNNNVNFILIKNIGEVFKTEIKNENIIHDAFKKLN
jgi:3-dehydroquinate synthase